MCGAGIDDPSNGLNDEFVRSRIKQTEEQIFQASASHLDTFDRQEKAVAAAEGNLARPTTNPPGDVLLARFIFGLAFLIFFFGGLIALIAVGPAEIWSSIVWLATRPSSPIVAVVIIAAVAALSYRVWYYNYRVLPPLLLTLRGEFDAASGQLSATKAAIDGAVHDEVQKNVLGLIANATAPFYQKQMFVPDKPDQPAPAPFKATTGRGLSEVTNSSNEVPTAVYHDLLQSFERLPGASIGICGPRGAGKSTLLWSICGANRKIGGYEAIAVYTAAPVEYETRDFLLHIFSCVCQQVLKTKGVADDRSAFLDGQDIGGFAKPLLQLRQGAGLFIFWLGAVMTLLGLLFGLAVWDGGPSVTSPTPAATSSAPQSPSPASSPQGAAPATPTASPMPAPSTSSAPQLPSPASSPQRAAPAAPVLPPTPPPSPSSAQSPSAASSAQAPVATQASPPAPAPSASSLPSPQPVAASGASSAAQLEGKAVGRKSFADVLEIKPGPLVLWGVLAIVMGVFLISWEQVSRLQTYDRVRDVPIVLRMFFRRRPKRPPADPLVLRAQQHLHDIRFQRSYSSGWSGALKIPTGFETGATLGTSLAQKQESLPELVERFRGFAELITRDYAYLIIGIDELDKLKSETDARKFVNEIKAIFNIPKCFYLLSVSENAISNFERRGMPFRDEFDSAFDDIRHIDYLTLDGSRHLLGRRVLNLPEAFLCLCHVLAAGLPRDLIRMTRGVLDQARLNPNSNSIEQVAEAIIAKEVSRKVRAIEIASREIPIEPEATEFLQHINRLRAISPTSSAALAGLLGKRPSRRANLSQDEAANLRKLTELWRELDAFLYFAVTTVELFAHGVSEREWRNVVRDGRIEELGHARQAFELNVGVVEVQLDRLREACGMTKLERGAAKVARPRKPRSGKKSGRSS
jgi:hypothetical protein